ncbi:hypothetical protein [Xenorhabdus szentirmaii]|uniref:Uncharacterized protein n=3 Tax=Xenorhabdus szentirmaii TaxID=290112 RepID=W1J1U4_9GAMM|nr:MULTISPECIES: hypothetical protein [Xenorhabdus]MBD2801894.1 hypothetical protein [Xenorhabdus sp. M]PHM35445.1 ShlB/FhaC/HecB family hemolysin secretion/activation protein [Xenorhabdus szentirmaii DSM 16338]CDL84694.1 hypothetical protein XSR1_50096 [Xenorhabdus szentirmaii DSM 16338]
MALEQDLSQGELKLAIIPETVRQIRCADEADKYITLCTDIPAYEGKLLDFIDIVI